MPHQVLEQTGERRHATAHRRGNGTLVLAHDPFPGDHRAIIDLAQHLRGCDAGYRQAYHFKAAFQKALTPAVAAYPGARVDVEKAGLVLRPSAPPVTALTAARKRSVGIG